MRVRRLRVTLACACGVLVALTAVALATIAIHDEGQARDERGLTYLATSLATVVDRFDPHNLPHHQYDTWLVDTASGVATPLGYTDVQPPLTSVADDTLRDGSFLEEFTQNGDLYAVMGVTVPGTRSVLESTWDMSEFRRSQPLSILWYGLGVFGVFLVSSTVVYLLAARLLRPVVEADKRQRDFLANAAHELRTPFTVVQASSSQALARERSAEEYRSVLVEVRTAAEKAAKAISDMFDLARLEAGETTVTRMPLRLDLLGEEVVESISGAFDGVLFSTNASEPVIAHGDDTLLRQAIENLLTNAARRAGKVTLEVTGDQRIATIRVSDDGPGFDPEILDHVFDRYRQGADRSAGGAGLGLAITRSIVVAHGGTIKASNAGSGGAVVTITIPV